MLSPPQVRYSPNGPKIQMKRYDRNKIISFSKKKAHIYVNIFSKISQKGIQMLKVLTDKSDSPNGSKIQMKRDYRKIFFPEDTTHKNFFYLNGPIE